MDLQHRICARIETLERQLDETLRDGVSPDSYNVGWIEGALVELRRLLPSGAGRYLVQSSGDWVCPECNLWIDPTELGCGCDRVRPPHVD